ncbi:MAG: hypothetical protein ACLR9T_01665 [Thomasclavelia sp.]|uniref:hypothetical protein n=1 Tax=Thomasclavelia sp. TaxID=3025757 RepID=UPI0039A2DAEF
MDSIKEIIKAQELKKINYDPIFKIIAIIVTVVLLYIAYKISMEGFRMVPVIGNLLNDILIFINDLITNIADIFRKIFGNF